MRLPGRLRPRQTSTPKVKLLIASTWMCTTARTLTAIVSTTSDAYVNVTITVENVNEPPVVRDHHDGLTSRTNRSM